MMITDVQKRALRDVGDLMLIARRHPSHVWDILTEIHAYVRLITDPPLYVLLAEECPNCGQEGCPDCNMDMCRKFLNSEYGMPL